MGWLGVFLYLGWMNFYAALLRIGERELFAAGVNYLVGAACTYIAAGKAKQLHEEADRD